MRGVPRLFLPHINRAEANPHLPLRNVSKKRFTRKDVEGDESLEERVEERKKEAGGEG